MSNFVLHVSRDALEKRVECVRGMVVFNASYPPAISLPPAYSILTRILLRHRTLGVELRASVREEGSVIDEERSRVIEYAVVAIGG